MKLSSTSPDKLDVGLVNTRPRSARRRRSAPMSTAPSAWRIGPSQKTRPTTDASWSTRRSASGRDSMRATRTAWIDDGIAARSAAPVSTRWRTVSSRKYGLPSARARAVDRRSSGNASDGKIVSARVAASAAPSDVTSSTSRPSSAMNPDSRPRNAGRAVATSRNGPSSLDAICGSAETIAEPAQ